MSNKLIVRGLSLLKQNRSGLLRGGHGHHTPALPPFKRNPAPGKRVCPSSFLMLISIEQRVPFTRPQQG